MYWLKIVHVVENDPHCAELAGQGSSFEPILIPSSSSHPVQNQDVTWIDCADHTGTRGGQDHEECQG